MRKPLTHKQVRELVDLVGNLGSVKGAAELHHQKPSRVYGVFRRVRLRRAMARTEENYYLAKQRTNPYLKRLLEPTKTDLEHASFTLRTGEFKDW